MKFTSDDTRFLAAIANVLAQYLDRMEAEAGLRRSEARLAEVQRIAGLGNWVWDIESNDAWWSDQVYQMFGLSPSEFKPSYETFLNIVHPNDRDYIEKSVYEVLNGKKAMSIYYRVALPNGPVLTFHDTGKVTFNSAGRPIMVTGTVRDVTKEREAEEALRRYKEELEQRLRSLHEITAKPELPMHRQIEEAIKAGAVTLSMEFYGE